MPAATVGGNPGPAPGKGGGAVQVPFLVGSSHYAEKIFTDNYETKPGQSQEFVHNITPGGFLRGVSLYVKATGGSLGQGTVSPDNPWSLITSISLENIDGSPIKYPMSGYAYYLENKYSKPWMGDPTKYSAYSRGINPSFVLRIFPEIRDTAGVLANTDARAQYRIRYTLAGGDNVATGNVGAWPNVTVTGFLETWAQTDAQDLHGNPIAPLPPGLSIGSLLRHDVKALNAAGADNLLQLSNTGNEYRTIILVVRDSKGERQDYLSDPIRFRLDDRSVFVRSPESLFSQMEWHYDSLGLGIAERETGVYVIPRFRQPGQLTGSYWLPTSNATYVMLETATAAGAKNLPGTVEIITDEVVPINAIPLELEGI
ncbi:hypothetical protein [Saccharopolyspora hattusasensis]|uniref:hypothetical protein n=1 Tax=Saccharopolyspora hattusasensis TaxID=1128679 RepID=UPI003D96D809